MVGLGITYEEQNSKQMVLPQEYPDEYGWTLTEPVPFTMKDVAELLTSTVVVVWKTTAGWRNAPA